MAEFLKLKKSNCRNCYKCIRHCPVKSIRFSGNQAHIVAEECILCGECFVVCPQNAKEIVDETEKVKVLMQSGDPVIASIAPSFIANYPGIGIRGMAEALKKLGFTDAEETARGATMVKKEYDRLLDSGERDVLISSCCHSINLLIQKHYPQALPYLADVASPMQAHCLDIKSRIPNAKTVFIGPCVAKLDEADRYPGIVDAAITFEELSRWMAEKHVVPVPDLDDYEESRARLFPIAGGIIKSMECKTPGFTYIAVDGVENCMAALKDLLDGKTHRCFLEMSACAGSCVRGPVMEKYHSSPIQDYIAVSNYAGKKDFRVPDSTELPIDKDFEEIRPKLLMPSEDEITELLHQMGKMKPEDELNCGSCGYNSCREKAIGIYQGKADISMCLPYLMGKSENFSDCILNNTPNGILVLNEKLEVQQINNAAMKIMNIRSASDVLGAPVVRIMDPKPFLMVQQSGRNIREEKTFLAEYGRYVEETITFSQDYRNYICILRDFTEEAVEREKKEKISKETVEVADKVVEKQMRVVQDIASLLGETAAETKIALAKLKESITND